MERTNLVCRHGLQYHKKRLTKITHNGFDYTFAYDGFGNRKSVSIAGKAAVSHDYTYDAQGQLTREYDPDKKLYLGYQYDAGGNLTEVCSYPAGAEGGSEGTGTVLKRFAYGSTWKDQMTVFCQALFPKKSVRIPCF